MLEKNFQMLHLVLFVVFVVIHFEILVVFRFLSLCNIFQDNEHKGVQTRTYHSKYKVFEFNDRNEGAR